MNVVNPCFYVALLSSVLSLAAYGQPLPNKYLHTKCHFSIGSLAAALGAESPIHFNEDSTTEVSLRSISVEGTLLLSADESKYKTRADQDMDSAVDVPAELANKLVSAVAKPLREQAAAKVKELEGKIQHTSQTLANRQQKVRNDFVSSVSLEREYFSTVGALDAPRVALVKTIQALDASCGK